MIKSVETTTSNLEILRADFLVNNGSDAQMLSIRKMLLIILIDIT